MDSLQTDSADDQTFLLIRLPKETVARSQSGCGTHVGSVYVFDGGYTEFQDDQSKNIYSLLSNSVSKLSNNNGSVNAGGHHQMGSKRETTNSQLVADDESDLFKISLQKDEAIHLGKVKLSTLLAVPRVDEKDVSAAFG